MSCSNFKLANYPNLDAKIRSEVGNDNVAYTNLAGLVTNDLFNQLIVAKQIDIENNPNAAYDVLLQVKDKVFRTLTEQSKRTQLADKGYFGSYEARQQALDYCAAIITKVKFNSILKGTKISFSEIQKELNKTVMQVIANRAKKIAVDNNLIAEYNEIVKSPLAEKYSKYVNFVLNNGTNQDKNYAAIGKSLMTSKDTAFMNDLVNRKNVINILKSKAEYQYVDDEELGGYANETDNGIDESGLDSKEDAMAIHWNNNGGELSNFEKHVEEVVRYQLSYIPKLINTGLNADGNYNYDLSNKLGTPSYSDYNFLYKLLFSSTNCTNVETFTNSIKYIAETIDGAEGLIVLYDYLKANSSLAYKYMMVFNKPIIRKVEVYLDSLPVENEDNHKSLNARITNTTSVKKTVLISNLINNIKAAMTNNIVDDALKLFNLYRTKIDNQVLYEVAHRLYPDITRKAIDKMVEEIGLDMAITNIKALGNIMYSTKRNYDNYKKELAAGNNPVLPDSFIPESQMGIVYALANLLENKLDIAIELNSRNIEGNLTSDILNHSYITILDSILHGVYGQEAIDSFVKQKFATNQYEYSNLLIEHTDENGKLVNYGIFRKVIDANGNASYELTEYAQEMFNLSLLSGIADHTTNENDLYKSMSDGDYFVTMLGLYTNQVYKQNVNEDIVVANYLLPIPSDAPKNFSVSAPRYSISKLNINNEINRDHILFKQFVNIALQEVTDMAHAINMLFKCDANGTPIVENGNFVMSDLYNENPDVFYNLYFKNNKGKVIGENSAGETVLLGNIFNFNRIKSELTPEANKAFANLIGRGKAFDFLYGGSRVNDDGSHNYVVYRNGRINLNAIQMQAIEDAVAEWMKQYGVGVARHFESKYSNFYKDLFTKEENPLAVISEFAFNSFLMNNAMQDLYIGNPAYYKNPQTILKRAKEAQAGGSAFGNIDFSDNSLTPRREIDTVKIDNAPLVLNGKEVKLYNKYKAVTIYNTEKTSSKETIKRIEDQLKTAGVNKATRDRLLAPFRNIKTATNDAQSYITFDEWVRRITNAGELEKYAGLIKALSDDTPVEDINWEEFDNKVQVQKNFSFDLYYDSVVGRESPRQIKNAEFVLIPKLIKGTDLERIHNIMVQNDIQQLNTKETVKAGVHNVMTLWDAKTGQLTDKSVKEFNDNVNRYVEEFSYNYLYRQQEVPQHIVDSANKAAIQIMKKILDNLDDTIPQLKEYKQTIFDNYVGNIRSSFNAVCDELNIARDENGNIKLDEQGNIPNINRFIFFAKFKEQAAQQGLDEDIINYFSVDMGGFNNLPLFMTNVNNKLESIVNGYFNSSITRQTISGWHAAQIADFGFNRLGTNTRGRKKEITTSNKLQYKVVKTINDKEVRHIEIYLPKWSKFLDGMNLNAKEGEEGYVSDEIRTMIGYRIPTEGKQSIAVMHVVPYPGTADGFLPSAYGSSVVVPDEWVTQTGSDFDIDSVYAMSKTFFKVGNSLKVYNNDRYSDDIKGYINYIKDNADKEAKKVLGKTFVGNDVLYKVTDETVQSLREAIETKNVEVIGVAGLNNFAKDNGIITYDEYLNLSKVDRSSQQARANAIIQTFIDILNHSGAAEESSTTSNFDSITNDDKTGANDIYAALAGESSRIFSPNDPVTSLAWFTDATSGIKIKGISVNRDTFCSLANVTKAQHKTGIRVKYDGKIYSKKEAEQRFGEDNVEVDENGNIIVTHKNFAWSNDNRNIDGNLITPYSSQTTAHILDVMKKGAIHNENTFTFNAFKSIVDLGSNYDTAIGFMWQPAMDLLVSKWKETNSVTNNENVNPLTEAIRDLVKAIAFSAKKDIKNIDNLSRKRLLEIANDLIGKKFAERFKISLSDAFSKPDLVFSSDDYKKRLVVKNNRQSDSLFDLYVLAQFNQLDNIGKDISNNLNVLSADKYGAKQSFYLTDKIFRDARSLLSGKDRNNIVVEKDGKHIPLLQAVFPGILGGINSVIESNVSDSVYPSLAAFLKYGTALSLKVGNAIFDTSNPSFSNKVWALGKYLKKGITEKEYNGYKNYLINKLIVGNEGSPYLIFPVTIIGEDVVIPKEEVENTALAKTAEFIRISGSNPTVNMDNFKIADVYSPTGDEIHAFAKLTPAQKVLFIKNVFGNSVFEYIETNLHDARDNKDGYLIQYLNYNPKNLSANEIHRNFKQAMFSSNPLVRLTAIDIIKYAYMIEHNTFRSRNVSRAIGNVGLESYYNGGLSIGTFVQSAMEEFKHKTSEINDVVAYARMNYDTFNCQNINVLKKIIGSKVSARFLPGGIIKLESLSTFAHEIIDDVLELNTDENDNTIIRHNKVLYLLTREGNDIVLYPLNRLSKFEIADTNRNSVLVKNDFAPLGQLKDNVVTYNETRNSILSYFDFNDIDLSDIREVPLTTNRKPNNYIVKNQNGTPRFTIHTGYTYFTQQIEDGVLYQDGQGMYVGVTGEKALSVNSGLRALQAKYPNSPLSAFGMLVRVEPRDLQTDVMFSEVEDSSPVGKLLADAAAKINDSRRRGDKEAAKVVTGMKRAGINFLNPESVSDHIEFTSGIVGDYIAAEADIIISDINRFLPVNIDEEGEYLPITDDKVIEQVLKDYKLQDRFLKVILAARTFADKYKGFTDIDASELEGSAKKNLETIQDAIKKVVGNTQVISARKKWLQQFIMTNSNNPNIKLGLMDALDAFGDTSFLDYYIQDIRSNKNLIVQNVIKVVDTQLETARLYGIEEANKFNEQLNNIIKEAKSKGINVSLNDIIKGGRLIQPNDESWQETKESLDGALRTAEEFHGKYSIEWLKAKNRIDSFIAATTVSKTLPVKILNSEMKEVEVDYRTTLANLDTDMIVNHPDVFAKYKQETAKLYTILSSVSNNMTSKEQDKEINQIYDNINNLTSLYDEDGNPKSGPAKATAEALRNYIKNVKELKEMFMDKEQKATFETKLNNVLDVIKRYEVRNDKGQLMSNINELMKIDEYRQAKEWLKRNTSYVIDVHTMEDIRWAFDKLRDTNRKGSILNEIVKKPGIRDEFGTVDGRLISDEDVVKIKKEVMDNYHYVKRNGLPYGGLIRATDDNPVVYNHSFYDNLRSNKIKTQEEIDLGEKINTILEQYFDNATRTLMTSAISYEHLVELKELFEIYDEIVNGNKSLRGKEIAEFIESECISTYDDTRFNADHAYASEKGVAYKNAWEAVFGKDDKTYNRNIYGILKPKNEAKWVDEEKTEALSIIRTRTIEDTTQYYEMRKEELVKEFGVNSEEYRTWWKNNHYYDPFSRTFKPLRIWTTMKFTNDEGATIAGKFEPKVNQMDISIKDNLLNPEYPKSGANTYKYGSRWNKQSFDNTEYGKLNDYHHQLIDLIKGTMQKFVYTNSDQYFIDKGYLPSIPKAKEMNWNDAIKAPLDFIGWSWETPANSNWINDKEVNYANDYNIPNPMLKTLVSRTAKKLIEIPAKLENQSEEDYKAKVKKIQEENAKIKAENEKYHSDLVNDNWEEVFKAFIISGTRYNAVHTMKSLLYAAENIISETPATEISSGTPKIKGKRSNEEYTAYRTEAQTRTASQIKEYIRRVVFEQYKENPVSNYQKLGNLAQNIAGSKYMMMNITGGIANVLTGSSNIMMERIAGEYAGLKDWELGKAEWLKASVSYIANMYSDTSSTIQDAIIKLAKVVDYDRYIEVNNAEGVRLGIQRARSLMFSPQTIGEHYMQNTMLFTMMMSHRLKTYPDGRVEIITKERNHRDAELSALKKIIAGNDKLTKDWNDFIAGIKADMKLKAEYDLFKKYPISDFVKQYLDKAQQKEFIKARKELQKKADAEFEKLPKVYDQFELKDGVAKIKTDSNLTKELFAGFVEKVKRVNNKVHGVYDKIGAARIENQWWGGMAMQYHKHLYPGFKKRYRWNGYYNETLDTIEKGSYKSLWDFIMTPLRDVKPNDDPTFVATKALQNYTFSLWQFWSNVGHNWNLLPENERANIARNLGDLLYVGAAIVGAIAISGMGGDDDDDIAYNLALYHADRLASEAASFTPIGLYAEAEKLWSSPIAIQQTVADAFSVMKFTVGLVAEDGFASEYTTGRYKGQNKFNVMLQRNIPVVRSINRVIDMPNNNSYYKLNENMLSIIPYKEWGDAIFN